jgi:hypothetical protein
VCQEEGRGDTKKRYANFQNRSEKKRLFQLIGPSSNDEASQCETRKEGTYRNRYRVNLDSDNKRELLDPENLIDQSGCTGTEEQYHKRKRPRIDRCFTAITTKRACGTGIT